MGGDIHYEPIGNDSLAITVEAYKDCSGIPFNSKSMEVITPTGKHITCALINIGGYDITPVAHGSCTSCSGSCGSGVGIQKVVFTSGISLKPYGCGAFELVFQECCVSGAISTGDANEGFYVKTTMYRCAQNKIESSPVFEFNPLLIACEGMCTSIMQSAKANNGDSIVYSLIKGNRDSANTVLYINSYNYLAPITYNGTSISTPWDEVNCKGFHYDAQTGELNFKAKAQEVSVLSIGVDHWHKDSTGKYVLLSETQRQCMFRIVLCGTDNPPYVTGIDSQTSTTLSACVGEKINFKVISTDKDSKDTVTLSWNKGIPKASFTIDSTKLKQKAIFTWTPSDSDISNKPYTFIVTAEDSYHPWKAKYQKIFSIYVRDSFPKVTYSKTYTGCNNYTFKALTDSNKKVSYNWYIDNMLTSVATGQAFNYQFKSGINHYIFAKLTSATGCTRILKDSVAVDTSSFPIITYNKKYNSCNTYTFNALTDTSKHVKYAWTIDHSASILSTTQNFSYTFTSGSKHYISVQLTAASGCTKTITDSIIYDPGFAHSLTKDTTICKTESVKLKVSGGKYHIWRPSTWLTDSTSSSPVATPDSTITYYVTSTDSMQCPQKDSVTIIVDNDCVWPGDANKDKTVDLFDFLNVGVGYGTTGSPRTSAAINWQPYRAGNWGKTTGTGVNYKHIDCNGDGTIDYKDTLAITKNYGSKHSKTEAIGKNGPPVKWVFAKDTFYAGDTVKASLTLGSKSYSLTNAYGIAAEYPVNAVFIKDNSLAFNFDCDLLCGSSQNLNWYRMSPFGDKLSLVSVKTDNTGKSGYGKVATLSFVAKDTTEFVYGPNGTTFSILPSVIKLIDHLGNTIDVDAESDSLHLLKAKRTATVISETAFDINDIHIYPNPAKEEVTVETGRNALKQVIIYNALGSIVQTDNVTEQNKTILNVSSLSAGVYFICLKGENFTSQQKLLIQK
jgi:hypothetical protein